MSIRVATHAGSWYSSVANALKSRISSELSVHPDNDALVKYIITPHAGYDYSLKTASYAYFKIRSLSYSRIFILGPSHHVYFEGCGLDKCIKYETPIGNLDIDTEIINNLLLNDYFMNISKSTSEDEHSIEMQLPILRFILEKFPNTKIVPIMIGDINDESTKSIANTLLKYFDDKNNLFVISSDFCHFGARFGFYTTPYPDIPIHEAVERLDKDGIELITNHNYEGFLSYLSETKNTICGRNPIQILLELINLSKLKISSRLENYSQSNPATSVRDSSVSYAAIVGTIPSQ